VLPGITLQGTLNIPNTKLYTGLEFSYTFGGLRAQSHSRDVIHAEQIFAFQHRRMSRLMQGGVLLGHNFTDFSLYLKAGLAYARVRHKTHFDDPSDLHYQKNVPGYYVGVGYAKEVTQNFAVGVDYEYASFKMERRGFHNSQGVAGHENSGYFKSQSKVDTLKLRLIYKI
jgi:opacity protein-like surface antigen